MDTGSDGVGNDLRELLAIGVEVGEQDGSSGASRDRNRKGRAEGNVGVPVGDLGGRNVPWKSRKDCPLSSIDAKFE